MLVQLALTLQQPHVTLHGRAVLQQATTIRVSMWCVIVSKCASPQFFQHMVYHMVQLSGCLTVVQGKLANDCDPPRYFGIPSMVMPGIAMVIE